jgi:serine/threonine protein kinase
MPLSPGERLGPYEILEPIGAAGMGEVYKARDTRLERPVSTLTAVDSAGEVGQAGRVESDAIARYPRWSDIRNLAGFEQRLPVLSARGSADRPRKYEPL